MDNIYQDTLQAIAQGQLVQVDVRRRRLTVERHTVIDGGQYTGQLGLPQMPTDEALRRVEEAYAAYKHSVPERGRRKSRSLFKAVDEAELSDEQLMWMEDRRSAQCRLELTLLLLVLNGSIGAGSEVFQGKWFWQSERDHDLVILKEWIA